jgi:hypothetical protein
MARADHILVPRLGGLFVHHGIDCGDGTVIHFTGDTWADPRRVRRTSLQDFARGGDVAVRDYQQFYERLQRPEELPRRLRMRWRRELQRLAGDEADGRPFAPDAVIGRAESRLGLADFDIVLNNCEHFATWCKTGISDSEQVYSLWRNVLDPMAYVGLRRSQLLTALFEAAPHFDAIRPSGTRTPRRR